MSIKLHTLPNTRLEGCVCLRCGNVFYREPGRFGLVCDACNRYTERPDLYEDPALSGNYSTNRFACRITSLIEEENARHAK